MVPSEVSRWKMSPATPQTNTHLIIPRVARMHELIEALRARAPRLMTGDELSTRLGVSVRTVERDVAALRAAGVPISVHRGRGGGYAIDARPRLPPVVLTPGEAAALVTVVAAVGTHVSATAHTAMDKLLAALTSAPPAPP
jgi:predicted DNA-binding transcriptional regulator YafY